MASITTLYKYRLYCNSNSQWEYTYDTKLPTICPINSNHNINLSSISVIDQISAISITSKDSPYYITQNSIVCDTSLGNIILNLPNADRCVDIKFVIKKISSNNTVSIIPNNSQLIDGMSIKIMSYTDKTETIVIKSDGINWTTCSFYNLSIINGNNDGMISTRNKGDLLIDNGKEMVPLPALSDNFILLADSTQKQSIKWSNLNHSFLVNGGINTHTQIDDHISATSGVHGISSDIVEKDKIQELRNKTIINSTIRATQLGDIILSGAIEPVDGNLLTIADDETSVAWETRTSVPGGENRQVQYNDYQLGGTEKFSIDSADGSVILGSTNDITSNKSKIFAKSKGGRNMSGQRSYVFQQSMATNKIGWWTALGNSINIDTFNFNNIVTGTTVTRNCGSINLFTSERRIGFISEAISGSSAGTRHGAQQFWIGHSSKLGGFFYLVRFGITSTVPTQRVFVGLIASSKIIDNRDPSQQTNILGFGADSGDTSLTFMHNDNVGTATKENLVGNFSCQTANSDMYEIRIYCGSNSSVIYYSVENLSDKSYYESSVTNDIPSNATLLSPQIWINNGTSANIVGIDVVSQYIETVN